MPNAFRSMPDVVLQEFSKAAESRKFSLVVDEVESGGSHQRCVELRGVSSEGGVRTSGATKLTFLPGAVKVGQSKVYDYDNGDSMQELKQFIDQWSSKLAL